MPRVVPSQVVRFIDSMPLREFNGLVSLNSVGPALLSGLLDLVDEVPEELLTMDSDAYSYVICAKAEIKAVLATWTANRTAGHQLQSFQYNSSKSPLELLHDAFVKCPDESPAPGTSELSFITDPAFRMNLRNDVGAIDRALFRSMVMSIWRDWGGLSGSGM